MFSPLKHGLIALLLAATCAPAQTARQSTSGRAPWTPADIAAMEAATEAEVRAVRGDLGLPVLPPVGNNPRLHDIADADRMYTPSKEAQAFAASGGPTLVTKVLGVEFTGTSFAEFMQYQLPTNYDSRSAEGHPIVIAYHGYAGSHQSTALQSQIHIECENRGWIYLAPIGLDSHFFGPPITMQHVRAALDWMRSNFNVDDERIYMVGFSMGAGVSANFTARHRDPNDVMVAALGLISGTYDWTQEHLLTTAGTHFYMEHPLCFEGPPSSEPFNYQRASTQYFDPLSYTPATLPGTRVDSLSMGINLGSVPTYVSWDSGDTLPQVAPGNAALVTMLEDAGTDHVVEIVSGTMPPHSWNVLDEVALFDFFEGRTANRTPNDITVLTDEVGDTSFLSITPRDNTFFTRVDASTNAGTGEVILESVVNATEVSVDVQEGGVSGIWPVHMTATADDNFGFTLHSTNYDNIPSYKLDHSSSDLIKGLRSDPTTDSVFIEIAPFATLDADVLSEPWTAKLSSTPNPVLIGNGVQIDIDTEAGNNTAFLNVGFEEILVSVLGGAKMTSSPLPPALLIPLPLDANGDAMIPGTIPNDAAFSGLDLFLQVIATQTAGNVGSVSNMWVMDIE